MSVRLFSLDRRPFHPVRWSGPWGSAHLPNAPENVRGAGPKQAPAAGASARVGGARSLASGVACR